MDGIPTAYKKKVGNDWISGLYMFGIQLDMKFCIHCIPGQPDISPDGCPTYRISGQQDIQTTGGISGIRTDINFQVISVRLFNISDF